ncbi:MAG: CBS domain-containing protein [Phycisphaerales bacterium JB059]
MGVRVADIMTKKVLTVDMDRSLSDVRRVFERAPFHHLVVIEDGKLVGLVSDRDVFREISPFVGTPTERSCDAFTLRKHVHQIMTRQPQTCAPDTEASEACRLMLDKRISCLPVVNARGRCVGIVTIRDVAHWALREIEAVEGQPPVDGDGIDRQAA